MSVFSTIFDLLDPFSKLKETNKPILNSTMFKLHPQNNSSHKSQELPPQKIYQPSKVHEQPSNPTFPTFNKKESKTSSFTNAFRADLKPSSPFSQNPSSPFSQNPSSPFSQNPSTSDSDLGSVFMSDGENVFVIDKRGAENLRKLGSEECGVNHEKSENTFANFWKRKTPYSKASNSHTPPLRKFPDDIWERNKRKGQAFPYEDFFSKPFSSEKMEFMPRHESKYGDLFMENIDPTFLNVNLLTPNSISRKKIFNKQKCTDDELQQNYIFHDAYDSQYRSEEPLDENTERSSDYEDAFEHIDDNLLSYEGYPGGEKHTDRTKSEAGDNIQRTDQLLNSASCRSESFRIKDCFSDPSHFNLKHNPFNVPPVAFIDKWSAELLENLKSNAMERMLRRFPSRQNNDIDMALGDPSSVTYTPKTLSQTTNLTPVSKSRVKLGDVFSSTSTNITDTKRMCDIEEDNVTNCSFQNADHVQAKDTISRNSKTTNCVEEHQENIFDSGASKYVENSITNFSIVSSHESENETPLTSTKQLKFVEKSPIQPQLIQFYDDNIKQNRNVLLYTNQALKTVCKQVKDDVPSSKIWNILIKNSVTFGSTKIRGVIDLETANMIPPNSYSSVNKSTTLWKRFRKPLKSVTLMVDLVSVNKMVESKFISPRFLKKFRAFAKHEDRFKSGFVITRSKSNLWLTKAGLYNDGKLDPSFASQCFEQYVKRRLVINPYDYMLYLVKLAYKSGIDINLIYDRMIASELPSSKASIYRESRLHQ